MLFPGTSISIIGTFSLAPAPKSTTWQLLEASTVKQGHTDTAESPGSFVHSLVLLLIRSLVLFDCLASAGHSAWCWEVDIYCNFSD